jgi:hypothetical protein
MIRARSKPAEDAAEPAGQPDDVPETVPEDLAAAEFPIPEPPAGDATAAEIAELGEQCHLASDAAASRAERDQAEYDARMDAVREKAARMIADEEAQARPLAETAAKASVAAGELGETRKLLHTAGGFAAKAEAVEAAVRALEAERDDLAGREADIGRQLAGLAAEKSDLEPKLANALDSDDRGLITQLRNDLDSISAQEDKRRAQQAPLLARLADIGDGEMSPIWPQKELAEARRVAHGHRRQAASALDYALPGRPEAVAARERAHEQLLDRMESEQRAADRRAAQQAQRRQVVHL